MAEVNVGGRPPNFKTVKELQDKINQYIENPPVKASVVGGEIVDVPTITITGLCWFLGFESRQSFYDYGKTKRFSYTIKRARLFIESEYEAALKGSNCTGPIFALKKMGWSDKQDDKNDADNAQPLNINFTVSQPVSDIQVTRGEKPDGA